MLYLASIRSHVKHTHLKVLVQSLVLLPGRYSGRHEEDSHRALEGEFCDVGDFDEDLSPRGKVSNTDSENILKYKELLRSRSTP